MQIVFTLMTYVIVCVPICGTDKPLADKSRVDNLITRFQESMLLYRTRFTGYEVSFTRTTSDSTTKGASRTEGESDTSYIRKARIVYDNLMESHLLQQHYSHDNFKHAMLYVENPTYNFRMTIGDEGTVLERYSLNDKKDRLLYAHSPIHYTSLVAMHNLCHGLLKGRLKVTDIADQDGTLIVTVEEGDEQPKPITHTYAFLQQPVLHVVWSEHKLTRTSTKERLIYDRQLNGLPLCTYHEICVNQGTHDHNKQMLIINRLSNIKKSDRTSDSYRMEAFGLPEPVDEASAASKSISLSWYFFLAGIIALVCSLLIRRNVYK